MNLPIEDQYPSTSDMAPPMAGAQNDPVLSMLLGGRQRIVVGHSTGEYISRDGKEVCAVGSIMAQDGLDYEAMSKGGRSIHEIMEEALSKSAKEAIALLNAKAIELYPESADYAQWSGPFEWVNQSAFDEEEFDDEEEYDEAAQGAILAIYDNVIAERRGERVPA